jgi:hypothetical protein
MDSRIQTSILMQRCATEPARRLCTDLLSGSSVRSNCPVEMSGRRPKRNPTLDTHIRTPPRPDDLSPRVRLNDWIGGRAAGRDAPNIPVSRWSLEFRSTRSGEGRIGFVGDSRCSRGGVNSSQRLAMAGHSRNPRADPASSWPVRANSRRRRRRRSRQVCPLHSFLRHPCLA